MTWPHLVPLVHSLGFILGGVLYAMLAVMTWRASAPGGDGGSRLALATALLGLVWNIGALVLYGARDLGFAEPSAALAALSFSALGFLPGVVVHASLGPERSRAGNSLLAGAYILSAAAALLHVREAWVASEAPSRLALLLLTIGFGIITGAFGLLAVRRPGTGRALPAVALAAFAVMALHLSHHSSASDAGLPGLLAHHATTPLAFVILYENYRFALADLFLKRALGVTALVAAAGGLYLGVIAPLAGPAAGPAAEPGHVALILALWVATALAYPGARTLIDRFVDRVVLARVDYRELRAALARRLAEAADPEEALAAGASAARTAFSARTASSRALETPEREGKPVAAVSLSGGALTLDLPTSDPPAYRIEVGGLPAGRRLLSDDFALLETVGLMVARRIDALRVDRERYDRAMREREIRQLAAEAELRALRAQLHPHFLFNSLTTLGHLMRAAPERALDALYQLTALLRSVLRETGRSATTLGEELELVEAYLAIERARFEERLEVEIAVPSDLRTIAVVPLLLQPLVENAVKHGLAPTLAGGRVSIRGRVERDESGARLRLEVGDTGRGASAAELAQGRRRGVGLTNLERRLALCYGPAARLEWRSTPGRGTLAELLLPFEAAGGPDR